jgi:hypothetical protein
MIIENSQNLINENEEYDIPLDISDIINICREFNKLGWNIQSQIESMLELGVAESINNGIVNKQSLPHIKNFLNAICRNPYFGDAILQAEECINLINLYIDVSKDSLLFN